MKGTMLIFQFFLFAVAGWMLESAQESIVRRQFVSKGFFRGPWVPVQGLGGLAVYFFCAPFRAHPAAVFLLGMAICTAAEYLCAVFLERAFGVQCWDYRTYPHTRWCHFQGRVCLTISLFFGVVSLAVVYVFWNFGLIIYAALGTWAPFASGFLAGAFAFDAVTRVCAVLAARRSGRPLIGWALFTSAGDSRVGGEEEVRPNA